MTTPTATDPVIRVWTMDELTRPPGSERPQVRRPGDRVRVATTYRPNREVAAESRYPVVTPCCGKTTYVTAWHVERMGDGDPPVRIECGKPVSCPRGNPRNGGCRARYAVTVGTVDVAGHTATFDLTWTGR